MQMSTSFANFAMALFVEATHVANFQHRWMLANTWADKYHDKLNDDLCSTGKDLIKALLSKSHQHLADSMAIINQKKTYV